MTTTIETHRLGIPIATYNRIKARCETSPDYNPETFDQQVYAMIKLCTAMIKSLKK